MTDQSDLSTTTSGDQAASNRSLANFLMYTASLPERVVRSTVGVAAGAAREAAQVLVPQSFQTSKTYEVMVENSLKFLTDQVGGAQTPSRADGAPPLGDEFLARKAVGNFVDLAGLATLHVSPLWILVIASDVAYGSKTYLRELAEELKQKGLVSDTSTITRVDDLLDSIQKASGETASLFDTPPLSTDQLKESLERTRSAIAAADYRAVLPEAEMQEYWNEMRSIAGKEGVGLVGVSGALTMHTLGKIGTLTQGALTGVQVAGGLFNRHVIGSYGESLRSMREKGFHQVLRESSAPYVAAVWRNFADERETITGDVLSGKLFRRLRYFFRRLFRRRPDAAADQGAAS